MNKASSGFSLPGILIAIGIFSILSASMMSLMSYTTQTQATAKFRSQVDSFHEEVRAVLGSMTACTQTFQGIDLNPAAATYTLTQIRDNSGNVAYQTGTIYGDNAFALDVLTASNYVQSLSNTAMGTLDLTLLLRSRSQVMGGSVLPRTIRIQTRIDAAGAIVDCVGLAKMSDGIWQYVPPTPPLNQWNIHYIGGRVGIGTSTPRAQLNVYSPSTSTAVMVETTAPDSSATFIASGVSGGSKGLVINVGTNKRWQVLGDNSPEAGANSGSDLRIQRFSDDGVSLGTAFFIRRSDGFVGINNANPSYNLDITGDLRVTGTPYRLGGDISWSVPSDARLKDVIGPYEHGLDAVSKLNTVRFHFKPGNLVGADSKRAYIGVLAQQAQLVLPEAVSENPSNGYLALNTTPIFWAMVNSVKELKRENAALRAWICEREPKASICRRE